MLSARLAQMLEVELYVLQEGSELLVLTDQAEPGREAVRFSVQAHPKGFTLQEVGGDECSSQHFDDYSGVICYLQGLHHLRAARLYKLEGKKGGKPDTHWSEDDRAHRDQAQATQKFIADTKKNR